MKERSFLKKKNMPPAQFDSVLRKFRSVFFSHSLHRQICNKNYFAAEAFFSHHPAVNQPVISWYQPVLESWPSYSFNVCP